MHKSIFSRESLTFIFVVGIITLASVSVLTYMNIRDQTNDHDFISDTYSRMAQLDNIMNHISEAEASRRGYFITGDNEYVTIINENYAVIDTMLRELRSNSLDNTMKLENAESLKMLVKERFNLLKEGIETQDKKGTNQKYHKTYIERGKVVNQNITNLISKMKSNEEKKLQENLVLAQNSSKFTYLTLIGGVILSSFLFILVFAILRKKSKQTFDLENQEISREELEQIVKERTAEISQINHKLYQKVDQLEKMDAKLVRSEKYYRMLFEQAHDAIIIFSPEGQIVLDMNNRACELYGFSREEFKGISLNSISKNIPQGNENVKATLEKGYYHNFQSVQYKKDSTEMLIEINASLISYNDKPAILSINRDLTHRILKY
ncbi:MAG: CHASE3 domain-containing protein [Ignavibacteria bacterium]|nr:CHASE3 domain-containing protein [Ignavibacteria bacterium]